MIRIIIGVFLVILFLFLVLIPVVSVASTKGITSADAFGVLVLSALFLTPAALLIYFGWRSYQKRDKELLEVSFGRFPKRAEAKRLADENRMVTLRPESSESHYGLSVVSDNKVKYVGPLKKVDLDGSAVPDVVRQLLQDTPSAHLLILPQMGLVIWIKSSSEFHAFQFMSPMSVGDSAAFMSSMLRSGRRIQMVEQYGAIELQ